MQYYNTYPQYNYYNQYDNQQLRYNTNTENYISPLNNQYTNYQQYYNNPQPIPYQQYNQNYNYYHQLRESQNFNMTLNNTINSMMYNPERVNISIEDIYNGLRGLVYSDEELEIRRRNSQFNMYNYNRIYDPYQQQREYEKYKQQSVNLFSKLSIIARGGNSVSEEQREIIYNHYNINNNNNSNISASQIMKAMTPEVAKKQSEYRLVDRMFYLDKQFEDYEQVQQLKLQKIAQAYSQIKESHDRALNLPKNADIYDFFRCSNRVYGDMLIIKKNITKKFNGNTKYDTLNYTANMYSDINKNKDYNSYSEYDYGLKYSDAPTDYVPIEYKLKERYRKERSQMFNIAPDGTLTLNTLKPHVPEEILQRRSSIIDDIVSGMCRKDVEENVQSYTNKK